MSPMNPRLLVPRASGRFLLDVYGPAQFAYSLRRLRSGYNGPVVQVRRSNDNAEANFNADEVANGTLAAWVGAGNDGRVKTWYDQSTNGFHASQATAAAQPTIVSNGVLVTDGGLPSIQNANNQGLRHTVSYTAGLHVLFAVAELESAAVRRLITLTPEQAVLRATAGQLMQAYGAGGLTLTASTTATFPLGVSVIASVVYNHSAGTMQGFANNTQNLTFTGGAGGTASVADIDLLGTNPSPAETWVGLCSELVGYISDVTGARSEIVNNMNRHYGVF